jgi:hypothetical protein
MQAFYCYLEHFTLDIKQLYPSSSSWSTWVVCNVTQLISMGLAGTQLLVEVTSRQNEHSGYWIVDHHGIWEACKSIRMCMQICSNAPPTHLVLQKWTKCWYYTVVDTLGHVGSIGRCFIFGQIRYITYLFRPFTNSQCSIAFVLCIIYQQGLIWEEQGEGRWQLSIPPLKLWSTIKPPWLGWRCIDLM